MSALTLSMAMPMSIPAAKGRILCVDDEPNVLRALSWLLQKEFEVVTATSGQEGLDRVRGDRFDVVISDQRMPGMSGVDFLTAVKAADPRAVRILLTGYSDLQAVLRSVNEAEIFRYISKPWNISELPGIVAQAAEIARSQPAAMPAAEVAEVAGIAPGQAKILVLDQNPQIHAMVELSIGDLAPVIHAHSIGDAVHALKGGNIGAIVAEARTGSVDLTHLLCLMKQRHPEVAGVVLAEEAGLDQVADLINRGQIFRFVPMPIKAAQLRDILYSALRRNHAIKERPALARHHAVEALTEEEHERLQAGLRSAVPADNAVDSHPAPPALTDRVTGMLRRLLSLDGEHA